MRIALKQTIFPISLHNKHKREFSEISSYFFKKLLQKNKTIRCI